MIFFVSKSRISNFRSRNINFVYLINFTNILKSNIFVNLYKFVDTGILGLKKKKKDNFDCNFRVKDISNILNSVKIKQTLTLIR